MNKIIIVLLLLSFNLYSQTCFIVTDVETDRIVLVDNEKYSQKELFPGSLLKPFALLPLSNESDAVYVCSGWNDLTKRCWLKESHNEVDLIPAIAYSCNSYFIQYLEKRLSLKDYFITLTYYLKFTGLFDEHSYIKESIGLGTNIRTTPINILLAYNKLYREKPKGIEIIRQGMKECGYYGTGKLFTEITGELDVACKTGTSYRIESDGSFDWKNNTGWFLVMYPADQPKYSFLTVIDSSKSELAVKEGSKNFLKWLDEN